MRVAPRSTKWLDRSFGRSGAAAPSVPAEAHRATRRRRLSGTKSARDLRAPVVEGFPSYGGAGTVSMIEDVP